MDLTKFFKERKEKIILINPSFGYTVNGFRYITTDKCEYKEDSKGQLHKFNKGLLEEGVERWEKVQ
ncbi:hypothetical protein [Enterococcus caccae]|uniref:hypothetical protein n=1 Tax=Enterococcus caccae TaxID=317735 RepID=UPI00055239AF|nr:hypothetical protein [Enterococcus caccae]